MSVEEVTLSDLWRAIRLRARLIIILTLLLGISGLAASYLVTPIYTAEALLAPVADESGSGGSSGASPLASIASLAGLGVGESNFQQEAQATLESRTITERFISDHGLMPELFPSKWDQQRQKWKSDDPERQPNLWDGNRLFGKKVRTISVDKKTGLLTLSIAWRDPRVAADWANELVRRTNDYLRGKAIARAEDNISFLQTQLDKTSVVDVRQAIFRIIESQLKTLTLAEGNKEYAFKVIDPAAAPHRRTSPNRLLYTLGGILSGLLIGLFVALLSAPVSSGDKTGPRLP